MCDIDCLNSAMLLSDRLTFLSEREMVCDIDCLGSARLLGDRLAFLGERDMVRDNSDLRSL